MNKREWLMTRWITAGSYAVIILIAVPWLLIRGSALGWLPILMAAGPFMAGLWLFVTHRRGATKCKSTRETKAYRQASVAWLVQSLIVAVIVGLGAVLAILVGSVGWYSYSFLTFGDGVIRVVTYVLLGTLPVIAYMAAVQRLLAKRSIVLTYVLAVVSLLAPWFWAGFAVYSEYHQL
ncbi:hypothetical protein H7X68_03875 [Candidatus Saccharibacteria bacterium]|nr:hypothetical protein [Candidatus Saccharibacteria bacterium]